MSPSTPTLGALAGALLLGLAIPIPARGQAPADEERARIVHLLQRATYGPRPGDVEDALAIGEDAWLERQLHPETIEDRALVARLDPFPAATLPLDELFRVYPRPERRRSMVGDADSVERRRVQHQMRLDGFRSGRRIGAELAGARLQRAVHSERQLEAVMTEFWFNRFNVFWGKGLDRWLVGAYEREAIRPHVFGHFSDLLAATARHPAMLVYLDNWRSVAPDSLRPAFATRFAAGVPEGAGFNENYARELLELHTLGVDGGYTQDDVVAAARALTGWSLAFRDDVPEFRFRPGLHDVGEKRFLGHALPAGRGIEDGEELLEILARHPSTARHVAQDLAEAFVADDPPPALVSRLERVFLETDGDLRAVTRALFTAPEFYDPGVRRAKVKSPFELVASALRLTGAEVAPYNQTATYLREAGEIPYGARDPVGYPETAQAWIDGGAMLQRMNLALALAAGDTRGVRIEADALAGGGDGDAVESLASRLLPEADASRVIEIVDAELSTGVPAGVSAAERALGLILGSPEFQRH